MAKKNSTRTVTDKQKAFVKGLADGKNVRDAALAAGYSPKNPDQSGHQALKAIQKRAPEIYE